MSSKNKKMKSHRGNNSRDRSHEETQNGNKKETQANRVINIDKIIHQEIERMTQDKKLSKDFSADLSLLKKHWNALCTTYKRLANARHSYIQKLSSSKRRIRK